MEKVAVIYKSKYGSTKRYAEWISQEVNGDLFEASKVSVNELLKYDTIVYGGGMYAVGILGISLIRKNYEKLRDKKVIVFTVGASPSRPEVLEAIKNSNFTDDMKERVSLFHFRGAFDYRKLNIIDKMLMSMLKKKLEGKSEEELTNDDKGMLASYKHPADWTNKKSIEPLIKCIKSE